MATTRRREAARAAVRTPPPCGSGAAPAHPPSRTPLRPPEHVASLRTLRMHPGGTFRGVGDVEFGGFSFCMFWHFHREFRQNGPRCVSDVLNRRAQ